MLIVFFAESGRLCLKDLSDDITAELIKRLQADGAALEKFYQYFGLKMGGQYPLKDILPLKEMKQMFPDTTVNVVKECFEVLRLYDLVEILEKVKPRSLRPAVSPEQIEKLRKTDDRPTKYHSDVAVLVVNHTIDQEDIVVRENAEKIETIFKDLNSRNEVTIISLASSQETREFFMELKVSNRRIRIDNAWAEKGLERVLRRKTQLKKELEKELEKATQMETGHEYTRRLELELELRGIKDEELWLRDEQANFARAKRDLEKLKELTKKSNKAISTAMDKLIHNQGWLTSHTYIHDIHVYSNKFEKGVLIELS